MIYDYCIIGGGIAGLYSCYQILKKEPSARIVLFEKDSRLGGRVHTYKRGNILLEEGAGRFDVKHIILLDLLKDLGLSSHILPIPSDTTFVVSGSNGNVRFPSLQLNLLLKRISTAAKTVAKEKLIHMTFIVFAKTVLNTEEIKYVEDSFGYYNELVLMNAHDAIYLMREIKSNIQFYGLGGGLSSIIDALVSRIKKHKSCKIYLNASVKSINVLDDSGLISVLRDSSGHSGSSVSGSSVSGSSVSGSSVSVSSSVSSVSGSSGSGIGYYVCKTCICALPRDALIQLPIFRPIRGLLNSVVGAPLCRVYARYPTNSVSMINGIPGPWFAGLTKTTTNNALRFIIPASADLGTIMISYSDNKFAKYWDRLHSNSGKSAVNDAIKKLVYKTLGYHIPDALELWVFYWENGVGYWLPGADSKQITKELIRPLNGKNIYICGENYSAAHQQWMEGALETSSRVIEDIYSKGK